MKLRFATILIILFSAVNFVTGLNKPVAVVTMVKGEVEIINPDSKSVKAIEGLELFDGFTVKTGEKGRSTILFNDGNIRFIGKNSLWSLKKDTKKVKSIAENTKEVISTIIKDKASILNYDNITGMKLERKRKPSSSKRSDFSRMKKSDTEKFETEISDDFKSVPSPEPEILSEIQPSAPVEPENIIKPQKETKTLKGIIPVNRGIISSLKSSIIIPPDKNASFYSLNIFHGQILIASLRNNNGIFKSEILEKNLLKGKKYTLKADILDSDNKIIESSDIIKFRTLSETEENNLEKIINGLNESIVSKDRKTLYYLLGKTYLKYNLLGLALKEILKNKDLEGDKSLAHLRKLLIDIYIRTENHKLREIELKKIKNNE